MNPSGPDTFLEIMSKLGSVWSHQLACCFQVLLVKLQYENKYIKCQNMCYCMNLEEMGLLCVWANLHGDTLNIFKNIEK